MPWTSTSFKEQHNKGLSESEAKRAATVANDVFKKTGDKGRAVRAGNAVVKREREGKGKK
jgi:hypothetical protein